MDTILYTIVYSCNNIEYMETYEDYEEARADYVHFTQGHLGDYNYIVLRKHVVSPDYKNEEVDIIDEWYEEEEQYNE